MKKRSILSLIAVAGIAAVDLMKEKIVRTKEKKFDA